MKRLSEIDDELERAVFLSVYGSRLQRQRRLLARLLLIVKHTLRGLFYIWPVYLVLAALVFLPLPGNRLVLLFILTPGLLIWLFIYIKGAQVDYEQHVHEQILEKDFIRKRVWPD